MIDATLTDNSNSVIATQLRRCHQGIRVDVRIVPEVEEFFQKWGGGFAENVSDHGRNWMRIDGGQPSLTAWSFRDLVQGDDEQPSFSLSHIGGPMLIRHQLPSGNYAMIPNLSFLRLCNASKGTGVSFVADTIMSRTELERLADKIKRASGQFYEEFIKPVHLQISVHVRSGGV